MSESANLFPSQWPRTLNVLGLGSSFYVSLNLLTGKGVFPFSLGNSFASGSDNHADVGNYVYVFMYLFSTYVLGEVLITLGLKYPKNSPEPLKLEARRMFAERDKSGFWAAKLQIADQRHELFLGIMVVSVLVGAVGAIDQLLQLSWLGVTLAVIYLVAASILAIFASSTALDAYLEMDQSMDAISKLRTSKVDP